MAFPWKSIGQWALINTCAVVFGKTAGGFLADRFTPDDIIVHDEYFGGKYAVPTPEGIEAIKLVGRTEGIILDPVYSGKTMSCLVDFLRKGMLDDKEAIVFVHTGGSPAIYNYVEWFR